MNSILQGDGHSGIEQVEDSLEHPIEEPDKYSVGLTNIPFSQNKKNYTYSHLYEGGLAKNNGDSVCILHLFKALRKGGRMAAIVPEGFLFRDTLAPVRKFLTDHSDLRLVVSLPQGVFLPYTGVKTDILFFENIECPDKEKHYWYFDVKNDGFTLNSHRRKIEGRNDLDILKDIVLTEEDDDKLITSGYLKIPFEKIRKNHENWIGTQYVDVNQKETAYPLVSLGDLSEIIIGDSAPQDIEYFKNGVYPFFRVSDLAKHHISESLLTSKDRINDLAAKKLKLFKKGTILFPKSGASSLLNHRRILGCDGYVSNHMACIIPNQKLIHPKYLFYVLTSVDAKECMFNPGYPSIRKGKIEKIRIPLPPLSIQQDIVNEIESYRKVVEGAKQVIQYWKPKIDVEQKEIAYPLVTLDDLSEIVMGQSPQSEFYNTENQGLPFFQGSKNFQDVFPNITTYCTQGNKIAEKNDILISVRAPVGDVNIAPTQCLIGRGLAILKPKNLISFWYLFYVLKSKRITGRLGNIFEGTTKEELKKIRIPLPKLETQKQIVEQIEREMSLIKNQKEIIEIFEHKISKQINSIWKNE
jgi:type I restriction enzyme M protein